MGILKGTRDSKMHHSITPPHHHSRSQGEKRKFLVTNDELGTSGRWNNGIF